MIYDVDGSPIISLMWKIQIQIMYHSSINLAQPPNSLDIGVATVSLFKSLRKYNLPPRK